MQRKLAILVAILKYFSSSDFRESYRTMTCTAEKSIICNKMCLTAMHAGIVTQPPLGATKPLRRNSDADQQPDPG